MRCCDLNEGPMKRIRYVSHFSSPMGGQEIDEIVKISERNNPSREVTGILVVAGQVCFQLLEGPSAEVTALYKKIECDPRHDRVLMLSVEEGDFERLCPDWAMARLDLAQSSSAHLAPVRSLLEVVFAQREILDGAVQALEEFTWQGLMDAQMDAAGQDV